MKTLNKYEGLFTISSPAIEIESGLSLSLSRFARTRQRERESVARGSSSSPAISSSSSRIILSVYLIGKATPKQSYSIKTSQ